jgi:antitoxin HicB
MHHYGMGIIGRLVILLGGGGLFGARRFWNGSPNSDAGDALEEATEHSVKAAVAWQLKTMMEQQHITKCDLAKKLHTSRWQIDRVLDPNNDAVTVATLRKAAEAVGQKLNLELVAA